MTPFALQPTGWQSDGTYTWAGRPSAVLYAGRIICISDIGLTGSLWFSDGVAWVPMNRIVVLGSSAVAASAPADATEDILATVNVPAGVMGASGWLRLTSLWSFTGSTNSKTMRARLGGIGGTAYLSAATTTAGHVSLYDRRIIANRALTNSQVGLQTTLLTGQTVVDGFSTAASLTSAIDTTALTTLVFTGQKATSGETLTLDSYLVELIIP